MLGTSTTAEMQARVMELSRAKRRLEKLWRREKRIAQSLQSSFLGNAPKALPGLDVAYRYHAAQADAQVGGDFYDVFPLDEDHVAVVVADVSGKGVRAALATVMVKYTLRAYAAEDPAPAAVLSRFNRFVCRHGDLDGFITVFYGLMNVRTGALCWGNAGHEPALLVRNGGTVDVLGETSLVVGAMPDAFYTENAAHLAPGDVLIAYTDGIVEARGPARELLGPQRIRQILTERYAGDAGAEEIVRHLYGAVLAFCGGHLDDDATLLAVRRHGA
jgi:sigma-B regulation protein RsbU (phosphoserine phosphatase)